MYPNLKLRQWPFNDCIRNSQMMVTCFKNYEVFTLHRHQLGAALLTICMSIANTTLDPGKKFHSRWSLFVGLVVSVSTWPGPCNSMKASRCRGTWPLYEIPFFFITLADRHLRLSFFWVLNIISATPEIKELLWKIQLWNFEKAKLLILSITSWNVLYEWQAIPSAYIFINKWFSFDFLNRFTESETMPLWRKKIPSKLYRN